MADATVGTTRTARSPRGSKVAIIGAGSVGSSLAYACLIRGSAREVALYDINAAKVDAEVLDLAHGLQFVGSSEVTGGADLAVVEGADIVVITAGAKQHPGETRLQLAGTNARMLEQLMPALLERAPDAIFVLVTNPCDVLTTIAQRVSGLPASRVVSTGTLLDTSRLRWVLARLAGGVAPSSVHAMIAGEHGDSEFAIWSQATIGPVPILEWEFEGRLPFNERALEEVAIEVRDAAYRVIEGKGATNYAIGLTGARLVEAVLRDERAIVPISSVLHGQWGIEGLALSVPTILDRSGASATLDIPLSKAEQRKLHASAERIQATLDAVGL